MSEAEQEIYPDWVDDEAKEARAIAVREPDAIDHRARVKDTIDAITAIRTLVAEMMLEGTDFGAIPGTDQKKKNLLLPGAQKANMFFNVRPKYFVERLELGDGHVEFIVHTDLINRASDRVDGSGVGSCSTMESKYRYRDAEGEVTDQPVPKAYWDLRKEDPKKALSLIGGPDYKTVKTDAGWMIARKTGEKVENPNIHDIRNTVLKMAKKRSLVDASLGLSCLSEFFTQDMEKVETFDLDAEAPPPAAREAAAPPPRAATTSKKARKASDFVEGEKQQEIHTFTGAEVRKKPKTENGKEVVKAWVNLTTEDGLVLSVWSETQAKIAAECLEEKAPAAITFARKGNFLNLIHVAKIGEATS